MTSDKQVLDQLVCARESSKFVLLRPHSVALPTVHRALRGGQLTPTWRNLGQYLEEREFQQFLTDGVFDSFIVATPSRSRFLGLVELIDFLPDHNRAQVSTVAAGDGIQTGLCVAATIVAMDEWFATTPVNVIHAMTIENYSGSYRKTLDRLMSFDGVLRDWVYINEQPNDVIVHSISELEFQDQVRRPEIGKFCKRWLTVDGVV